MGRRAPMSSREWILAVFDRKPVDRLPLCFDGICHGIIGFLNARTADPFEKARFLMDREVDTGILLDPPLCSQRGFTTRQWREDPPGEEYPLLCREYATPRGTLRQLVRGTPDYPAEVKLVSDHNVPPGRSLTYLVSRPEHLDALECILRPPAAEELAPFRERASAARTFCRAHGIPLSGYLLGVGDPLLWFSGVENVLIAAQEDPGFLQRYAGIVARWDAARMRILLDEGVDLIIRRGWYESTDFWSPSLYRRFLFGPLKGEIDEARQAGVRTVYVMNSGVIPLLDLIAELDPDALSNLDPERTDLSRVKRALGGRITLCGGINNYRVLERGSEEDVRKAVDGAVETMAPGGGFLLAPGDSILSTGPVARRNFDVLIDSWKRVRESAAFSG